MEKQKIRYQGETPVKQSNPEIKQQRSRIHRHYVFHGPINGFVHDASHARSVVGHRVIRDGRVAASTTEPTQRSSSNSFPSISFENVHWP